MLGVPHDKPARRCEHNQPVKHAVCPVHACLACLEHVAHDARDHDLDQRRECLLSNIYVVDGDGGDSIDFEPKKGIRKKVA